jgi:hypothetical protein
MGSTSCSSVVQARPDERFVTWTLLVLLGAWSALDGAGAGQFMISRPLVTATLTGLVLGDPATGFSLGCLLELIHLWQVPAGGARLPEPGPAAIPGVVLALAAPAAPAGLAAGLFVALVLSVVGGGGIILHRRLSGRLLEGLMARRGPEGITPRALGARLAVSLVVDALRGALVAAGGIVLVRSLPGGWLDFWPLGGPETLLLLGFPAAFGAGALARTLGVNTRGRRPGGFPLLLAGTALGFGLAWLGVTP